MTQVRVFRCISLILLTCRHRQRRHGGRKFVRLRSRRRFSRRERSGWRIYRRRQELSAALDDFSSYFCGMCFIYAYILTVLTKMIVHAVRHNSPLSFMGLEGDIHQEKGCRLQDRRDSHACFTAGDHNHSKTPVRQTRQQVHRLPFVTAHSEWNLEDVV